MSSVMPMSPYWACETIGGTSEVPRTVVGSGDAVGERATVAAGVTVGIGVGVVLVGVTQATIATNPAIRRAAVLTAAIFAYEPRTHSPLRP